MRKSFFSAVLFCLAAMAPAQTTINLSTQVHGVLPVANGGTGGTSGAGIPRPPSLLAGLMADYNALQLSGSTLADVSGQSFCGGSACTGIFGSGNGVGTPAAPTWASNGLSLGLGQGVSLPAQLNAARSFAFLVYLAPLNKLNLTTGTPSYFTLLTSSLGSASGLNLTLNYGAPGANVSTGAPGLTIYSGTDKTTVDNSVTGLHVFSVTLGVSGTSVDAFFLDGYPLTTTSAAADSALQSSGNLFLGSSATGAWSGVGNGCGCTLYRAEFWSGALTAAQHWSAAQALFGDAASRGVPTTPIAIPEAYPVLIGSGDSRMYGQGNTTGAPLARLALTNQPSYTAYNYGISGITVQQIAASETNRAAQMCNSQGGRSVFLLQASVNDFGQGRTAAQAFADTMTTVATMHNAGCVVFVSTELSGYVGSGNTDAKKDAYNLLLRTRARSSGGADGILDGGAILDLGPDGAYATGNFQNIPQGVHPTDSGYGEEAAAWSNAINAYFGTSASNPTTLTTIPFTMGAGDTYVVATGATSAGAITLPSCIGQSNATYKVINYQATYALTLKTALSSQPINGTDYSTTGLAIPANGQITLRDVANAPAVAGCHWEM